MLRNNWQVLSHYYLPAMLITSHYLPAACSFVQFGRHREGVLNRKDRFSQTKECQHLAALCEPVRCNAERAHTLSDSSLKAYIHASCMETTRGKSVGFYHSLPCAPNFILFNGGSPNHTFQAFLQNMY